MSTAVIRNLTLVAGLFLASSCAVHNYTPYPSTVLSSGNYDVVRTISAHTHHLYVFGFGGLNGKDVCVNLKKNAKLQQGEALANICIHSKNTMVFPFVVSKSHFANAEVIRWKDSSNCEQNQEDNTAQEFRFEKNTEDVKNIPANLARLMKEPSTVYLVDGKRYKIKTFAGYDGNKVCVILSNSFYKSIPWSSIDCFVFDDSSQVSGADTFKYFEEYKMKMQK